MARDLLTAYGERVGAPHLQFDANGCVNLVFNGTTGIDLEIDPDGHCLHVYSVLAPCPATAPESLCRKLLEANAFGRQTHGAALAIDGSTQDLLLCRRLELEGATGASVAKGLEDFLEAVQHWQHQVQSAEIQENQAQS